MVFKYVNGAVFESPGLYAGRILGIGDVERDLSWLNPMMKVAVSSS